MPAGQHLQRFIDAQQNSYETALYEIKNGRKRSHWMWFIFPQIQGLGFSETSRYYAIKDLAEASAFYQHPVLGNRLVTICTALHQLKEYNATRIFGSPDDVKLQSSMTLFAAMPHAHPIFALVLEKFFEGVKDKRTLSIIEA